MISSATKLSMGQLIPQGEVMVGFITNVDIEPG
jgi:hypothetical protein